MTQYSIVFLNSIIFRQTLTVSATYVSKGENKLRKTTVLIKLVVLKIFKQVVVAIVTTLNSETNITASGKLLALSGL